MNVGLLHVAVVLLSTPATEPTAVRMKPSPLPPAPLVLWWVFVTTGQVTSGTHSVWSVSCVQPPTEVEKSRDTGVGW